MACQCTIRRWVRGNVIGAGSFGKVNLAINVDTGELFAVKSIDCSGSGGAEVAAMENESRFLQSLDSPFIVKCFGGDLTFENGVQMQNLFMEYMAGGSLADLMRKFGGALDEALIRVYTRGILQGLSYLHGQGVVHCDVKGKNLLIGASGVKIADFGSAKRVGQQVNAVMRGTPLWMAPEVIMHLEQGPPSDIWSLACTIVEMATGRPPWSQYGRSNLFATLLRIVGQQDMPPFPDCLSAEGKDFLSKCLQRDPKHRWTAAQLLNHPFVQVQTEGEGGAPHNFVGVSFCSQEEVDEVMKVPLSPTSVLDVATGTGTGTGTATWDANDIPCTTTVPLLHCPEAPGRWITVRGQERQRQRQMSDFMLGKKEKEVTGGSGEVNLQSLHLLRAPRRLATPAVTAHVTSPPND